MRISDEAVAWRVFRTYEQLGHVIYQQEYVPHFGSDLRILVLGDRQHGIRRFNPTDWRTNVSRGAQTEAIELDDPLRELAWRAAQAVGAPFAGIDILPARDGRLLVLEVNAVPGWRALARTLHLDVASELLAWMRTHLNT
jgi:ribosomal protein S6--L-glutamate ligase